MDIGRKIYYDLLTGNVIFDTGERSGDVIDTSREQDFQCFAALAARVPETVGMIQLAYGQDADKFGVYAYHIDIATAQIVWSTTPINPDAPPAQPTAQEIKDNEITIMSGLADLYVSLLESGVIV